jgi:hypothetical protein
MPIARRCILALVIIWLVAAGALVLVQRFRATPEKFIAYVAQHPLRGLDTARRAVIIEEAAGLLNGLNTNQRREVKKSGTLKTFFSELTTEERRRFAELTLPKGFREMVATLNGMEPAQRKKVVQRTLRDLKSAEADEYGDESDIERMFSEGTSIFYREASPQVILDFAPVIEEAKRKREISAARAALPRPN